MFASSNNSHIRPALMLGSAASSATTNSSSMDKNTNNIEGSNKEAIGSGGGGLSTIGGSTADVGDDVARRKKISRASNLLLKPFSGLDPTIQRLLFFLNCFGLIINLNSEEDQSEDVTYSISSLAELKSYNNHNKSIRGPSSSSQTNQRDQHFGGHHTISGKRERATTLKILLSCSKLSFMAFIVVLSAEVVYDINIRQSKLLEEQKRSTPLLTFVIVSYSWLTLVIPVVCDICLIMAGSHLFRFYSRTMSTVCEGSFFGVKTPVDRFLFYLATTTIAFIDAVGQVMVLGVWPQFMDRYMNMITGGDLAASTASAFNFAITEYTIANNSSLKITGSATQATTLSPLMSGVGGGNGGHHNHHRVGGLAEVANRQAVDPTKPRPKITALVLDMLLGQEYSNNNVGVSLKLFLLMIHFMHTYSFLLIMIFIANHFANSIRGINKDLIKYEFRRMLRQLVILRDSSEQLSLIMSIPFAAIIVLVFMRLIALVGVFIQSTMKPYENWAVSLQSFTSSTLIVMVFIYCDELQTSSKQTHRLMTEQTVITENRVGHQSLHEYLDYLKRLTKSIRITFFNIIAINKSSLVVLYGHILTLTFVTS